MNDPLIIAGKRYASRLLVGTGKYRDFEETRAAVEESGAEIVTVAIRRTNIGQHAGEPSLLDYLPPSRYTYLPNTAGCYTAEDAVRTLRLARELLDGHALVKLEVLGDPQNLYLIIDKARVPVLVDAGVGTASDAAIAMELGCDAVLMNSAISHARNPVLMASAMKKAVQAGREAHLAGRMPRKLYMAEPSSPAEGLLSALAA